jgi:16S rRNA (guanine527-N7)-methyltransferase
MDQIIGSPDQLAWLRARVTNRFIKILRRSADRGFLGGMTIPDQVDHALGFAFAVEECLETAPLSVLDLGTGGGIPGLILMALWPDARVVLLDANERRTEFLRAEVLALPPRAEVEVVRGRAEELARNESLREQFAVVVSRSFGAPPLTAECGSAFIEIGGLLVTSEPPDAQPERWPQEGIGQLSLTKGADVRFAGRFNYQILKKSGALPETFPRRVGIPAKRPLF